MPPSQSKNSRFGRTSLRTALRTASPAVEIIARRLLNPKGKSIVPPELLSRTQKKKRDSSGSGRAGILSLSGTPKKNIEDSIKKLNKVAGRIGFYTIHKDRGENYENMQERWSAFRKTVKSCASVDDLRERVLGLAVRIDERFFRSEWIGESKERWMESCGSAQSNADIQACLRQFEQDAVCWEKVVGVHELMDISNQIPTSQVKTADPKFWFEDFPDKLRAASGPNEMARHLKELCLQLRSGAEIVDETWVHEKKNEWLQRCTACDSWPEFRQLMTNFDDDAIDWRNASRIMRRENESKDETKTEGPKDTVKFRKSLEEAQSTCDVSEKSEKRNVDSKAKARSKKSLCTDAVEVGRAADNEVAEVQSGEDVENRQAHDSKSIGKKRCQRSDDSGIVRRKYRKKDETLQSQKEGPLIADAVVVDTDAGLPVPRPEKRVSASSLPNSSPAVVADRIEESPENPAAAASTSSNSAAMQVDASQEAARENVERRGESVRADGCTVATDTTGQVVVGAAAGAVSAIEDEVGRSKHDSDTKRKVKEASKDAASKAKPAKSHGARKPRTGLSEHFEQSGPCRMGGSVDAGSRGKDGGIVLAGQSGGGGVWDGGGQMGPGLGIRSGPGMRDDATRASDASRQGSHLGGQFGLSQGGLSEACQGGADMGAAQRGVMGYVDAMQVHMDAQAFRDLGRVGLGSGAPGSRQSGTAGAGMQGQAAGLEAAAAQVAAQGMGRSFQGMGLGMQGGLGMRSEAKRMHGVSDETGGYGFGSASGGFGWGGQGWNYLGQTGMNAQMMQGYEDQMANMRMIQHLQSASMVPVSPPC